MWTPDVIDRGLPIGGEYDASGDWQAPGFTVVAVTAGEDSGGRSLSIDEANIYYGPETGDGIVEQSAHGMTLVGGTYFVTAMGYGAWSREHTLRVGAITISPLWLGRIRPTLP